jgi:uncharacterized membrane protein YcaP (DUF421 family)
MPSLHELFGLDQKIAHETFWFIALETLILIFCIMVIVEFAGRKTVGQMTMIQMIVTIGIGDSILMPIIEHDFSLLKTLTIVATMVVFLVVIEWLELKFNFLEELLTKKSMVVVENGKLNIKNLQKLRMTVDQLEMALRNEGISTIDILEVCTLEPNGKIGYKLMADENNLTIKEFKNFMNNYFPSNKINDDIFKEVTDAEHNKNHKDKHPKNLQ